MTEKTQKIQILKRFAHQRIKQIDQELQKQNKITEKLKLSSKRISFANILQSYLNDDKQVGISYFIHAKIYSQTTNNQQALFYTKLAKLHLKDYPQIIQKNNLLCLKILLNLKKYEEALNNLQNISNLLVKKEQINYKQQFFQLKSDIMQKNGNQEGSFQALDELQKIIKQKYSQNSKQMGLFLIEKGKKKGNFCYYQIGIKTMQQGMNILIENRYKNNQLIGKAYENMAKFSHQLQKYEEQHTYLNCANSIYRQIANNQKHTLEVSHKIVANLIARQLYQESLKQLLKIQTIQKQLYGQSSLHIGKTYKKLSNVLSKLNKVKQSKKYQQQSTRILSCNQKKSNLKQNDFTIK